MITILSLLAVAVAIIGLIAVKEYRRQRAEDAASAARVASSPHPILNAPLARAPDAFAEARARAATIASRIPPEVRSGQKPDTFAPRYLWWTTADEVTRVDTAILPPWLAVLFARRAAVTWGGTSIWSPPEFDPPATPAILLDGDACVITGNEFGPVFASPGRVTDLAGNPVLPPITF